MLKSWTAKSWTATACIAVAVLALMPASDTLAQRSGRPNDAYRPGPDQAGLGVLGGGSGDTSGQSNTPLPPPSYSGGPQSDTGTPQTYSPQTYGRAPTYGASAPAPGQGGYGQNSGSPQPYQAPYQSQRSGAPTYAAGSDAYRPQYGGPSGSNEGFGQPYSPPPAYDDAPRGRPYMSGDQPPYRSGQAPGESREGNTYSTDEIKNAGHGFFGSISQGLASVIEHTYRKKGRPNGYILGEEAGGAFVAGLRYGQGRLYTKDAGVHNVYWQGPSLGFDAGAEGSKVMVLVYNMRDVGDVFDRFGGIDGSAFVVGGVGVTFLSKDHVVMAPIRSGVGLRLGANVGYLKYTTKPTWNPF
jgi:hypothetical protein